MPASSKRGEFEMTRSLSFLPILENVREWVVVQP
jgi:hypothetical protein